MKILEGIRVVEIGQMLAGPFAGCIFADLGAEVVKIERPGQGDDARVMGPPFRDGDALIFHQWNRSKKSVALDLKTPDGRARLESIIATADIVTHNLRPDVPETLGISGRQLLERHPRLIVCEISGYGGAGPMMNRPAYEPLVQAFSGLSSINGGPEDPPTRLGASICDQGAGMWAVIGALAMLQRRAVTGRGGVVQASLLETALVWASQKIDSYINEGKLPVRDRSGHPSLVPYEAFDTKDKPIILCVGNDRLFQKFAAVVGRPGWGTDPRFATNRARLENKAELVAGIRSILRQDVRLRWLDRLDSAGVPCAPIHSIPEAADDPQVNALGIIQRVPDADFRLTGLPLSFDGIRPPIWSAAPRLGADNSTLEAGRRGAREDMA